MSIYPDNFDEDKWERIQITNPFVNYLDLPPTVWLVKARWCGIGPANGYPDSVIAIFRTEHAARKYAFPLTGSHKRVIEEVSIYELAIYDENRKEKENE